MKITFILPIALILFSCERNIPSKDDNFFSALIQDVGERQKKVIELLSKRNLSDEHRIRAYLNDLFYSNEHGLDNGVNIFFWLSHVNQHTENPSKKWEIFPDEALWFKKIIESLINGIDSEDKNVKGSCINILHEYGPKLNSSTSESARKKWHESNQYVYLNKLIINKLNEAKND